jgi:hypothetical protein
MAEKSRRLTHGLGKHFLAAAASTVITIAIFLAIGMLASHYSTGSAFLSTAQLAA